MVPSYYGQLFINFPLNTNATLKKKKRKKKNQTPSDQDEAQ